MKNRSNKQKKRQILTLCFALSILLTSAANNAFAQDVTLEWDISPSPDITLYNVYITDVESHKTWQEIGPIHDPSSSVLSYKVLGLDGTHQNCFSVTAFNNSGLESAHSNQVCKAAVASYPVTDVDKDGFDAIAFGGKDCNDANAAIHPGATDICGDGIDQDCSNGDAICPVDPRNVDNDGDRYTENQGDCNDTNAAIHPGATDVCGDGIDQDCSNGDAVCATPTAPTQPTCTDNDGDGFTVEGGKCGLLDCNDKVGAINPGSAEICGDTFDNNCDGLTDGQDTKTCPAPPTCTDADADGFFAQTQAVCHTVQDCNDNDGQTKPGTEELCGDLIDNDCDGSVDENCATPTAPAAPTEPTCTDNDGDGFAIEGGKCGPFDCNDEDPAINPGSTEICGDIFDNNCDGLTNGQDAKMCPAPPTCTDADADGFFAQAQADCHTVQDCNDNDGVTTYPGAAELCGDAIDNDCDGSVDEDCDIAYADGAAIYQNKCASCHGELPNSAVCGEKARDILKAIQANEGGMSGLSSLTDDQVKMIADALSNCNNDSVSAPNSNGSYYGNSRDRIFHRTSKQKQR